MKSLELEMFGVVPFIQSQLASTVADGLKARNYENQMNSLNVNEFTLVLAICFIGTALSEVFLQSHNIILNNL